MKNLIILGASGFVGKNLLNFFSKKKYNVTAVYFRKKINKIKGVKLIKADLTKYNQCIKVLKNQDIVLQCAATTSGSNTIIHRPYEHVTDNAIMNSYLLRASYELNIKHFIFTSCTVMYGNSDKQLSEMEVDEKKIFPKYYGVANTKLYIEKMCKFYSSISKTKFTIIRHSNLYGPHDKYDLKNGHFLASSISKVLDNKKTFVSIFGKGNEKRDFLYVGDFVNFVSKTLKLQKNNFEILNCSYGKSFSVIEILKKILKISNSNKKIIHISNKKTLNVNILVSSKKAKKKLSWYPKVKIEKGLSKTISWYKNNDKFL